MIQVLTPLTWRTCFSIWYMLWVSLLKRSAEPSHSHRPSWISPSTCYIHAEHLWPCVTSSISLLQLLQSDIVLYEAPVGIFQSTFLHLSTYQFGTFHRRPQSLLDDTLPFVLSFRLGAVNPDSITSGLVTTTENEGDVSVDPRPTGKNRRWR